MSDLNTVMDAIVELFTKRIEDRLKDRLDEMVEHRIDLLMSRIVENVCESDVLQDAINETVEEHVKDIDVSEGVEEYFNRHDIEADNVRGIEEVVQSSIDDNLSESLLEILTDRSQRKLHTELVRLVAANLTLVQPITPVIGIAEHVKTPDEYEDERQPLAVDATGNVYNRPNADMP